MGKLRTISQEQHSQTCSRHMKIYLRLMLRKQKMTDGPRTAKDAATRILLEEVGPLLDRADSACKILKEGHELLEKDMTGLGMLVSQLETTLLAPLDEAQALLLEVKKMRADASIGQPRSKMPVAQKKFPVVPMLVCAIFSSALAVGGMALFYSNMIEQSLNRRAATNALPYLDPITKQKLESAIQKADSQN